jgi:hypothetical protein
VRCDGTAALATCGSSERPILCEAALFVGDVSSTFSCNLALFVDIHAGKAAGCGASMLVSHRKLLLVEDQRRASWMVQKDKDRGASSASPARSVPLRRYQGVRDGRQRKSAILEYRFSASLPHMVLAEPTRKYFPRLQLERQVCAYVPCRARRVCVEMPFTSIARPMMPCRTGSIAVAGPAVSRKNRTWRVVLTAKSGNAVDQAYGRHMHYDVFG